MPLISLLSDAGDVVDRIIGTLFNPQLLDAGLFATLNDRLYGNVCLLGHLPTDEKPRKPFVMPHQCDLSPMEIVRTYLVGTPFLDLFLTPVPFVIPSRPASEPTHIVAGIGHGKTQLMQTMMLADFDDPARPAVVAIDSQGDHDPHALPARLLQSFHDDRLIILDPADTSGR